MYSRAAGIASNGAQLVDSKTAEVASHSRARACASGFRKLDTLILSQSQHQDGVGARGCLLQRVLIEEALAACRISLQECEQRTFTTNVLAVPSCCGPLRDHYGCHRVVWVPVPSFHDRAKCGIDRAEGDARPQHLAYELGHVVLYRPDCRVPSGPACLDDLARLSGPAISR